MTLSLREDSNIISLESIQEKRKAAQALLQTGHYKKLGEHGIYAIIQMAEAIGVDPIQALNGGLYPVDGKVEMDGQMMMTLIRKAGHSVTVSSRSTPTNIILQGKRKDTGDTWSTSFGLEDAKKAGLLSRGSYQKYGQDMFTWRALSRLARFLFPDVIKGCYAEGEISDAPPLDAPVNLELEEACAKEIEIEIYGKNQEEKKDEFEISEGPISEEQFEHLDLLIGDDETYRSQLLRFLEKTYNINELQEMPAILFDKVRDRALRNAQSKEIKNETK